MLDLPQLLLLLLPLLDLLQILPHLLKIFLRRGLGRLRQGLSQPGLGLPGAGLGWLGWVLAGPLILARPALGLVHEILEILLSGDFMLIACRRPLAC